MRKLLLCSLPGLLLGCPEPPPAGCQSATECNDDNACTVDSCDANQCKNEAVNLDDQIGCTSDSCDPSSGVISHDPQDNLCDDSVGCTVDACDPISDCDNTPDDNLCNGTDVCDLVNDCEPVGNQSNPQINTVSPNNSLALAGFGGIVITGNDLLAGATVTIGGVAAPCTFDAAPTQLTCNLPPNNTVGRVDIVVTNADAGTFTAPNAWTNTGVLNETDQAAEFDFCILQFPAAATATVNQPSDQVIFGQIFEAGLTDATVGQAAPGVTAELGFGPQGSSPIISGGWTFSPAQFNVETGINNNNDEYQGTLTIPVIGTFSYTYRFSLDGGINFTYCDLDGSGSNGGLNFDANQLGTIIVQ